MITHPTTNPNAKPDRQEMRLPVERNQKNTCIIIKINVSFIIEDEYKRRIGNSANLPNEDVLQMAK